VTFAGGLKFAAGGVKPLSLGWKAVQESLCGKEENGGEGGESGENGGGQIFPNISEGQTVSVKTCAVIPKKTSPPELHTEATLLTAMENAGAAIEGGEILKGRGIGTPATRAEIIKKLFDAGVVEAVRSGKTNRIQPTPKGVSVIRVLPEELYSPKITADWDAKIAEIAAGRADEDEFLGGFAEFIKAKTRAVLETETGVSFKKEREVHGVCPWCGGEVCRCEKRDGGASTAGSGKTSAVNFYCANKCGFNLNCSDKAFLSRLGRTLAEKEAAKFIAKGRITLECKKRDGSGTYAGLFSFEKRPCKKQDGSDGVFCNVRFDFAELKGTN
jgi:DNA topoisomerase-3